MKIPVPVELDGELYTDIKIKRPESLTITKTTDEVEHGDYYSALLEWNVGCTENLSGDAGEVTDIADIRRALRAMPFVSSYALAMHGMASLKGDSISGEYACPKCGTIVKAEKTEIDGEEIDTTDHLFKIELETVDNPCDGITLELDYPVILKRRDNDEVIEEVTQLVLNWPTLGQCIRANQKHPDSNGRMQDALYADSICSVNGKPWDGAKKTAMGVRVFELMDAEDKAKIGEILDRYSINVKRERVCMKCHNHWDAPLDFGDFFASGLGKKARPRDLASRGR